MTGNKELDHFTARSLEKLKKRNSVNKNMGEIASLVQSQLIDMLHSDNYEERVKGARLLVETGDSKIVNDLVDILTEEKNEYVIATLVKTIAVLADDSVYMNSLFPYLSHENSRVRANTIEALGLFDDETVFKVIAPYITERNNRVKANVAKILWRYSKEKTLKYLKDMLDSNDMWNSYSAVFALSEIGHYKTRALLIYALLNPKSSIRLRASKALHDMDEALSDDVSQLVMSIEDRRRYSIPVKVVNYQLKLISAKEPRERGAGCKILFYIAEPGDRNVINALKSLIDNEKDESVLGPALMAYLKIGRLEAMETARGFLKSSTSRLKADVIEGMGYIDDPGVLELVIPCLDDKANRVRANAAKVMWSFSPVRTSDYLLEMIQSKDEGKIKSAAFILGSIGTEYAREILLGLAAETMGEVMAFANEQLIKANRKIERKNKFRGSNSASIRLPVTEKTSKFINRNIDILVDRDFTVRRRAVEILSGVISDKTFRYFRERVLKEDNPFIQATLVKIIGKLNGDSTVDLLAQFLEDSDARVRSNTVEALGEAGDSSVAGLITPMLTDESQRVRESASLVLWKISEDRDFDRLKQMVEDLRGALKFSAEAVVANDSDSSKGAAFSKGAASSERKSPATTNDMDPILTEINNKIDSLEGSPHKIVDVPVEESTVPVADIKPIKQNTHIKRRHSKKEIEKYFDAKEDNPKKDKNKNWIPWTVAGVILVINLISTGIMISMSGKKSDDQQMIISENSRVQNDNIETNTLENAGNKDLNKADKDNKRDNLIQSADLNQDNSGLNQDNSDLKKGDQITSSVGNKKSDNRADQVSKETIEKAIKAARLSFTKFMLVNDLRNARKSLDDYCALKPDSNALSIKFASALLEAGKYEESLKYLKKILASDPENSDALYLAGRLYRNIGDFEKSLDCLEKLLSLNPSDTPGLILIGNVLMDCQRYEEALDYFTKAYEIIPGPESLERRARANYLSGNFPAATGDYKLLCNKAADSAAGWIGLVRLSLDKKWNSQAKIQIEKALELEPSNPEVKLFEAEVKLAYDQLEETREILEMLLAKGHENNDRIYYLLGKMFVRMGDLDQALRNFQEAIAINPRSAEYFYRSGKCYEKKRDYESALAEYTSGYLLVERTGLLIESQLKEKKSDLEKKTGAGKKAKIKKKSTKGKTGQKVLNSKYGRYGG